MARDFTKNVANYMSLGLNALNPLLSGAASISIFAWFRGRTASLGVDTDNTILSIDLADGVGPGIVMMLNCPLAPFVTARIGARSQAADALQLASGPTVGIDGVTWHSIGAALRFSADQIRTFLSMSFTTTAVAFSASAYTPGVPTIVPDAIGARTLPPGATGQQFDGELTEIAVWNTDIGDDAFNLMGRTITASAVSPLFIKPQNLVFYMPFLGLGGTAGPEHDIRNGRSGVITGSIPKTPNSIRTFYPHSGPVILPRVLTTAQLDADVLWRPRWF